MRAIILIHCDYTAYSVLQQQAKRRIKELDKQRKLINITQPLSEEDRLLIQRRMKIMKLHEFLTEKLNELVDKMPMPPAFSDIQRKGGDIC